MLVGGGPFVSAKRLTYAGNVGQAVDAVGTVVWWCVVVGTLSLVQKSQTSGRSGCSGHSGCHHHHIAILLLHPAYCLGLKFVHLQRVHPPANIIHNI